MRVFAFLDIDHPAVSWAVMRGILCTSEQLPGEATQGPSFMLAGILQAQNSVRLFNETIIEQERATRFPNCISRLQGMYFFESKKDAEKRISDKNWPRYFVEENLVELELTPSAIPTKVDANWITYAPLGSEHRINPYKMDWIRKYWGGEAYDRNPTWEIISKGVSIVQSERIRRECYHRLMRLFPECEIEILMARLASEAGSLAGHISPYLVKEDDTHVRLIYIKQHSLFNNGDLVKKMSSHPDFGRLAYLLRENENFRAPDFRPWGCSFKMKPLEVDNFVGVYSSIHHSKLNQQKIGDREVEMSHEHQKRR